MKIFEELDNIIESNKYLRVETLEKILHNYKFRYLCSSYDSLKDNLKIIFKGLNFNLILTCNYIENIQNIKIIKWEVI